jgi:FtsP/CotA-like multicopper oxidase with cupredoxin domain
VKNISKIKLAVLLGSLAIVLAGCMDSGSMQGMDHSKMGHSKEDTKPDNNDKNAGQPVVKTTDVQQLQGKQFQLTAMASNQEIAPGVTLPVWTFNNSVPGPELRVKQGEKVNITLKNDLPEPVSIHWHGLPVPNEMDGIPGVTQNAVQPGESFIYEFNADVPGTYWYHSHQDGVNQVDRGLYGTFIVEGKDNQVDRDYTLVLDEWMSSGSMNMDMDSDMTGMDHDMDMYDIYTINGKSGAAVSKLPVSKGDRVRVRLVNAGFKSHKIHLHGHKFKVTATDGQKINNPAVLQDQLIAIAPGERYDLEFEADQSGQWLIEGHGNEAPAKGMKVALQYDGAATGNDRANESVSLPEFELASYGQKAKAPFTGDEKFDLEYTMELGTETKNGKQAFTINGKTYPQTEKIKVKKGDIVKVKLVNLSQKDDHPMHLHGHFFQVLSKNGKAIAGSPIIKDTLNLKPGEEYVIAFEADNPGDWMLHCHDLHHASAGMMTHLIYDDFKKKFTVDPKAGNKPE